VSCFLIHRLVTTELGRCRTDVQFNDILEREIALERQGPYATNGTWIDDIGRWSETIRIISLSRWQPSISAHIPLRNFLVGILRRNLRFRIRLPRSNWFEVFNVDIGSGLLSIPTQTFRGGPNRSGTRLVGTVHPSLNSACTTR
jgi:hypothetical protein